MPLNLDEDTVRSFGEEWTRFDQLDLDESELKEHFSNYFEIFPWSDLKESSEGFDMGCGTGRWAKLVAPKVGLLHCVDPSEALEIAKHRLADFQNISFHKVSLDRTNLSPSSQDFGYSIGVLHHVPDTAAAIKTCAELLKPNAPLLLYIYYSFDNRPVWYKLIWLLTDVWRKVISRLPAPLKNLLTDLMAIFIYLPIARLVLLLGRMGFSVENLPLSYYRDRSFYTLRTDSRDRFGTPIEQRFSQKEIETMMIEAGLTDISFSSRPPFWCVVGRRT